MEAHEVKGVWFVTARQEVEATFGAGALDVFVSAVPSAHRAAVAEPLASAWYPEESLQVCLRTLRLELAGGEAGRFGQLLERCTHRGMGTFFSALVRLSSPRFLLGQVPTMWKRIRRGPGFVEVQHEEGETRLRYRSFPYFADPIYEELTLSSVRALMQICTGHDADLRVERSSADELELRVRYD